MIVRRAVIALVLTVATGTLASAQATGAETPPERPRLLIPLYVTQFALHGLDVHSTVQALDAGHREGNPLLRNANSTQMIGAKLASSAATVWLAEKLWKKNRVAAVVMMAGVNVGLTAVVANNYRLTRATRR